MKIKLNKLLVLILVLCFLLGSFVACDNNDNVSGNDNQNGAVGDVGDSTEDNEDSDASDSNNGQEPTVHKHEYILEVAEKNTLRQRLRVHKKANIFILANAVNVAGKSLITVIMGIFMTTKNAFFVEKGL
jgi:hypothetical protein